MNQVDCSRFIWHDHFALANDRLVDFYMRLPARLHFSRRFMAEYFKVKFPTLAAIPYQATGVDLYSKPSKYRIKVQEYIRKSKYYAERISKGKLRFYDMRAYIHPEQLFRSHNKMAAYFQEILLDDRTASRGYYNMKRLETLSGKRRVDTVFTRFLLCSLLRYLTDSIWTGNLFFGHFLLALFRILTIFGIHRKGGGPFEVRQM